MCISVYKLSGDWICIYIRNRSKKTKRWMRKQKTHTDKSIWVEAILLLHLTFAPIRTEKERERKILSEWVEEGKWNRDATVVEFLKHCVRRHLWLRVLSTHCSCVHVCIHKCIRWICVCVYIFKTEIILQKH